MTNPKIYFRFVKINVKLTQKDFRVCFLETTEYYGDFVVCGVFGSFGFSGLSDSLDLLELPGSLDSS